eukprot:CAMPEP_0197073056 /NCGR_PEP_ID=MMETSP1384-20130603/210406_1 /TAXON_ID=29189 /ORGANISM="Ammonia sp." /LENGTH=1037 /DNA_ID=CAMNT_0042511881 /DNA_START=129 /DNA_END=3241 /DNA_ORIENTATION=+
MSFIQQTEAYYSHKREVNELKKSENVFDHHFVFDADDLSNILSHFQEEHIAISLLAQMGGIEGISYALRTDMISGLGKDEIADPDSFSHRRTLFGSNEESAKPPVPFLLLCWEELKDPMLRILLIAAFISTITGAIQHPADGWIDGLAILMAVVIVVSVGGINNYQKELQFRKQETGAIQHPADGWIDGLAILMAVVIVVSVGGINNYQKELQFRKQEAESKKKFCIVLRGGEEKQIAFGDVVVGDLVVLRDGFTIPADGIFVLGTENLKAQEAGLTGESRELSKNRFHPLLMKGTNIVSGEGLMIAVAVGDKTEWGRLMAKLTDDRDSTPLQDKLEVMGAHIGWLGIVVAVILFLVLTIYWAIDDQSNAVENLLLFFIIAVTIVVVAVPEGLPLAVTISLAYSMKKMLCDNNFVRHLQACETMGNATTICSDKTGTLTTNKMSVSKCHMYGNTAYFQALPSSSELSQTAYQRVSIAICVNTKSFQDEPKSDIERAAIREGRMKAPLTGGNQTDCAMLQWVIDLGASNYKEIRETNPVTKFFPFDSKVKRSSVLCRDSMEDKSKFVMYVKGAAEQILSLCTQCMTKEGHAETLTEKHTNSILSAMDAMTRSGLRCLAVCYRSYRVDEIPFKSTVSYKLEDNDAECLFTDMTWICCVGIADPVRPEVPDAVATCQRAGIVVRMVTGDHLETAKHIAKQCGILTCSDHVCMTGGEFRELSDADKKRLLPRLRVLARSKPADKEELVIWYKTQNEPQDIVAVTGDGANDALALKNADVGLSMGIQGTDVAKEASDIIIMDDNFASIEKTVMWGRSVYDNIRKFVQFQLTVNVTALTISLIGAFYTHAALLDRHPFKKDSHLITKCLWRFILGHSLYQLTALILTLLFGIQWLDIDDSESARDEHNRNIHHMTVVFNVFVWMQIFNEVNARKVTNDRNVFVGILRNAIFWLIIIVSVIAQILLVQWFGAFAQTTALRLVDWGYCMVWGAGTLIWHQIVISVPVDMNDGIQIVESERLFKREPEFTAELKVTVEPPTSTTLN